MFAHTQWTCWSNLQRSWTWWHRVSPVQQPALHWPCSEPDVWAPLRNESHKIWQYLKPRSTSLRLHMTWWPPDQDGTLDPVERLQDKSDLRLFKAKETTTIFSVKVKLLKNWLDREGVLQHQFAGNLQCCYSHQTSDVDQQWIWNWRCLLDKR